MLEAARRRGAGRCDGRPWSCPGRRSRGMASGGGVAPARSGGHRLMPAVRNVAVIQARAGAARFPGKVLADLCGKPMLAHVIERVSLAVTLDAVVVATTVEAGDDVVASLAGECG